VPEVCAKRGVFHGNRDGHIILCECFDAGGVTVTEEGLQGVRFFEFLTEEERAEFAEGSKLVAFKPGDEIIEEGGEPGSLFVLTSGRVEVRKRIPGGGERLLAGIDATNERTVVGERGLLGESGASATVRATDRVEAIEIPRQTFRRMVSEGRPAAFKLSYRIARTLARRLTRLDEEVVEAIRELDSRGEADLEAFRDKLMTDWAV
jgi:CRP/FNR family cyclic AMP-dependent transcriptional regulator